MPNSPFSILIVLASFVLTFLIARTLSRSYRERRKRREEENAAKGQSRQVRRAKERSRQSRG
jgi:flagellar biosynthesis/type III secretory pathway M-ring protein FliF/YscJ